MSTDQFETLFNCNSVEGFEFCNVIEIAEDLFVWLCFCFLTQAKNIVTSCMGYVTPIETLLWQWLYVDNANDALGFEEPSEKLNYKWNTIRKKTVVNRAIICLVISVECCFSVYYIDAKSPSVQLAVKHSLCHSC